jgi:hypothetical protein
MPDKKCVIEFYKKIPQKVSEITDRLYTISPQSNAMYVFTFSGDWFYLPIVDGKRVKQSEGTWECKGNNNFIITTDTHTWDSEGGGWVPKPQSTTDTQGFSCVLKNKGNDAKVDSNGESAWFWVDEPNKIAHIFYKKDNKWTQSQNGVEQFVGRWNCDEEDHFLIVTDTDSYSSRSDNWEKISRVGDSNDSFPLKIESMGPNVVKLQKFLNDKIPTNPLTVNGLFDQKTQEKLIEFQKKEGIIE